MRGVLFFSLLFFSAAVVHAQEQEKKLVDRVLKPDMSLQNDAQQKQFVAGGETATKKVQTRWFFFGLRRPEKSFTNTPSITSPEFATKNSRETNRSANLSTRTQIAKTNVSYTTSIYGDTRTARDATRSMQTSAYPAHPFLLKGKSQKSLSAQDQPLTIDQVRELLNKSK